MLTVQTDEDGIAGSDFTMSAGDKLSKLQFLKLLHFTDDYGAGKLNELKKEIIWHSISEFDPSTRLRYLSESGFQRNITWLLGCRMNIRSIDDEHKLIVICRAITEFEIRSVGVLGLIFDIITIVQCILTFIRISDVRNHYEIGMALTAIDCVWTLDIGIRLVGTQWGRYCRSRHLLNGIITIIVFAVNIMDFCCSHTAFHRLDDSVELLRMFSVIGAVLEFMAPNRLYSVIVALIYALRTSIPIIVQMLFAMYSFAVLGMDLFGAVDFDNVGVDGTDLTEHYLWGSNMVRDTSWRSFNFESMESAMHLLFVDIIANNWHIFMFGFADILQSHKMYGEDGDVVSYSYFIAVMIVLPSISLSIVTAVLLDIYDSHGRRQENEAKRGDAASAETECPSNNEVVTRDYTQQILQKSADELYPNKYLVQCLDIRLNNFYELPPEHRINGIKYWMS